MVRGGKWLEYCMQLKTSFTLAFSYSCHLLGWSLEVMELTLKNKIPNKTNGSAGLWFKGETPYWLSLPPKSPSQVLTSPALTPHPVTLRKLHPGRVAQWKSSDPAVGYTAHCLNSVTSFRVELCLETQGFVCPP